MCDPATLTAVGTWFGGSTAAAGTAAAATAGTAAAAAGTTAAVAGTAATTAAAGLTTAQTISLGLSAAGAALGGFTAYSQAASAKAAAKANAQQADMAAQDAIKRGDQQAADAQRNARQMVGAQRAAFSARGIDISDGTAASLIDQTDFFGQADAVTARNNARKEAYAYRARAAGFNAQADAESPLLSTAGSLLGSAGTVSDKWLRYSGRVAGG